MLRFAHIFLVMLMLAAGGYVYSVKYQSTQYASRIIKLKNEIAKENVEINALNAEWAYLNRPDYLQALAQKHTQLKPLALSEVGLRMAIKERTGQPLDPISKLLDALENSQYDVTTTKIRPPTLTPKSLFVVKPKPALLKTPPIIEKPKPAKPTSLEELITQTQKVKRP